MLYFIRVIVQKNDIVKSRLFEDISEFFKKIAKKQQLFIFSYPHLSLIFLDYMIIKVFMYSVEDVYFIKLVENHCMGPD